MTELTIPQNLEAERALLGSILIDNDALALALDHLGPEDFATLSHREIFTRMQSLSEAGRVIDLITLSQEIEAGQATEKVGASAYIASLTDGVPFGAGTNVTEYARMIREKSHLRRLITASQQAILRAGRGKESAREISENLFNEVGEITLGEAPADLHTFRESALSLLAQFDRGPLPKILTGIEAVDQTTGGFLPGEMILIAAETTGSGKTLLAQQIRRISCAGGQHGLYCSAEMLKEQIAARELISKSSVPGWKMRRPEDLTREERIELSKLAVGECSLCRIMDGVMTMGRIVATSRRIHARTPLSLVVIDYDELVISPGRNETEALSAVAKSAKQIATLLKLVVVLISQVRKAPGGAPFTGPLIDKFFGSGAKAKHASTALMIDRPYQKHLEGDQAAATIWVCKSRDSRTGPVKASFDIHRLYFVDKQEVCAPPEEARYEKESDQ